MSGNHHAPGMLDVGRRLLRNGIGAIENRAELFSVELQEEKSNLLEVLFWTSVAVFLAVLGMVILTGTVIFLFREDLRIYAAATFGVLYLAGAVAILFGIRSTMRNSSPPFNETLNQFKKDRSCLDSLR